MKLTALRLFLLTAVALALAGCDQWIARTYGGNMTFKLPEGHQLVSMTWKETSLWVLTYDPKTKTCMFAEDSSSGVLEGSVTIPNCVVVGGQPHTAQ